MELRVSNVNQAVEEGLWRLKTSGVREETRNGTVVAIPEPFQLAYARPQERVLFWPARDANPVFHLMESLWMLAGRDDLRFVGYFNARMRNFSDNGSRLNGAYGHRWRNRFNVDQLATLIRHLQKTPNSRRAVLQMWGTQEDLLQVDSSRDVCCNTHAYFALRDGALDMTVCNRSNDFIWGMCGANAVHFSVLQEFIAAALGVPLGRYTQFSNNMHLYLELYDYVRYIEQPPCAAAFDYYADGALQHFPLCTTAWGAWLEDCRRFCEDPFGEQGLALRDPFFTEVARPMALITKTRKEKRGDGMYYAGEVAADDWRLAAQQWIERRENAK